MSGQLWLNTSLQDINGYPTPAMSPRTGYIAPMAFQSYTQGITPDMMQGVGQQYPPQAPIPDMQAFSQRMAGLGIYDPTTGMMLPQMPDLSNNSNYPYMPNYSSTPARFQPRSASISSSVHDASFSASRMHSATLSTIHSRDCSVETSATSLGHSVSSSQDVKIEEELASLRSSGGSNGSGGTDASAPGNLSKSLPGSNPTSPTSAKDASLRARSVTAEDTLRKLASGDRHLRVVGISADSDKTATDMLFLVCLGINSRRSRASPHS